MPLGWYGYDFVGYAVPRTPGTGNDPNSSGEGSGEVALVDEPTDQGNSDRLSNAGARELGRPSASIHCIVVIQIRDKASTWARSI
jgi:hypothetical protein